MKAHAHIRFKDFDASYVRRSKTLTHTQKLAHYQNASCLAWTTICSNDNVHVTCHTRYKQIHQRARAEIQLVFPCTLRSDSAHYCLSRSPAMMPMRTMRMPMYSSGGFISAGASPAMMPMQSPAMMSMASPAVSAVVRIDKILQAKS